nr:MAG TPA: hypothetical protein [Caudoviricetes sp.]DAX36858.1 MAG TPA: hypothetical protein [Caudoviricetes sp.]DAX83162.1 MAG TPA: hypothetical protein [Caudoviricetes sp.]
MFPISVAFSFAKIKLLKMDILSKKIEKPL